MRGIMLHEEIIFDCILILYFLYTDLSFTSLNLRTEKQCIENECEMLPCSKLSFIL